MQQPSGTIHIGAAQRHNAPGDSPKHVHQAARLQAIAQDEIYHDIGGQTAKSVHMRSQIVAIANDLLSLRRYGSAAASAVHRDTMSVPDQFIDNPRSDESSCADSKYPHTSIIATVTECRPPCCMLR
jgi:hypothetical protein